MSSKHAENRQPQQIVGEVGTSAPKTGGGCDPNEEALDYGVKTFTTVYNYNMETNEKFNRQDLYGNQIFNNLSEIYGAILTSKYHQALVEKKGAFIAGLSMSWTFYNNLPVDFAGKQKGTINTLGGSKWQKKAVELGQANLSDIFCK